MLWEWQILRKMNGDVLIWVEKFWHFFYKSGPVFTTQRAIKGNTWYDLQGMMSQVKDRESSSLKRENAGSRWISEKHLFLGQQGSCSNRRGSEVGQDLAQHRRKAGQRARRPISTTLSLQVIVDSPTHPKKPTLAMMKSHISPTRKNFSFRFFPFLLCLQWKGSLFADGA